MKKMARLVGAVAVVLLMVSPAAAIPSLQLGITDGIYVPEGPSSDGQPGGTTYSTSPVFTLNAYLILDKKNTIGDTYYISAAVVPQVDEADSLGSFKYGDDTINVTSGMIYGTPPVETYAGNPDNDLPGHGIFETYYKEFEIHFINTVFVPSFNVADPLDTDTGKENMYAVSVAIDTTGMGEGYEIHFDLYNITAVKSRPDDLDATPFAPFSHDAESDGRKVPEPGTLLLLGSGLLGLGLMRRRKN